MLLAELLNVHVHCIVMVCPCTGSWQCFQGWLCLRLQAQQSAPLLGLLAPEDEGTVTL